MDSEDSENNPIHLVCLLPANKTRWHAGKGGGRCAPRSSMIGGRRPTTTMTTTLSSISRTLERRMKNKANAAANMRRLHARSAVSTIAFSVPPYTHTQTHSYVRTHSTCTCAPIRCVRPSGRASSADPALAKNRGHGPPPTQLASSAKCVRRSRSIHASVRGGKHKRSAMRARMAQLCARALALMADVWKLCVRVLSARRRRSRRSTTAATATATAAHELAHA